MDIMEFEETFRELLQEMVVPHLKKIRDGNSRILGLEDMLETREALREMPREIAVPMFYTTRNETSKILAILDVTNKRLDDMNTHLADQSRRIDDVRSELGQRIDETNKRIDAVHSDLINRLDANNARIDRFFLESVSKDEQHKFDERVSQLEREVETIRRQIAA